ncbi:PAS domain-containing hybrid sensor histidine kinase/response regulator [Hymenobacter metallilatus]|uniref:Sensory/regulatory protein RpfC n=1 Tax=Hymenobacter metallilatus TaxID=2493666 RepID=A0A3R9LZ74_9BACT|nr:PAS domain-containing hybrid sensor histidine kinase/response regulator [Hymenobacter metallilatus]RSK31794.1 PAS domain-containing sensor histidine kinase [Hymenobacter metallilatus]
MPAELPATLAEAHALIRHLEEALAAEKRLVQMSALNPNPVYCLAPNGTLLYANPAALRLRDELGAAAMDELRDQALGWVEEALATGNEQKHAVSSQNRHFTLCTVPSPDLESATLYIVEVTERVQAENERAAQQTFTEQVLNSLPSMVYVRDSFGRYTYANQATQDTLARLEATRPVPAIAEQQVLNMASYAATDAQVLRTGQELMLDQQVLLPSGEVRWVHTVKRPLTWANGLPHVLGISTDVTELKQAREEAEAAAQARANFLANMSHEIRTPLNGVLGIAGQLAKTALNPRQQELVGIIRSSGKHLLEVINDVLDMAKITSGKLELAPEPFDLCEAMFQASQPLALQAIEKGLSVGGNRLRETCPHPEVIGDSFRINQIMLNLLSNAIKFTPAGGSIHAGAYQVAETEDYLTIEFRVSDTGVGIAPDKQERIFESFTQAYADTTRQFGGTGLGLTISRALVEQMGGQLRLQSELGKGSTFSFQLTLPRAGQLLPAAAEHTPVATQQLQGKRVLLVEDNDINRLVARMLLEEWGVELDEAEDGPAGVAAATRQRYDVVLMDIQLPGMSGVEATAAIRSLPDPQLAQVPIVALTANAFEESAQQYLAAGMNACISKPFEEEVLFQTLTALLA